MSFPTYNIEDQYEKDTKLHKDDVRTLIKWCKSEEHLPNLTEHEAILFLTSCQYDVNYAEEVINNYFTLRTKYREIFGISDPLSAEIQNVFETTAIFGIPKLTPEGYRVITTRLINTNYRKFNLPEYFGNFDMVVQLFNYLYGPSTGTIAILDSTDLTWSHLTKITFSLNVIAHYVYYLQDAVPVKVRGIYMVNNVGPTEKLIKLIKPLMKKELADILQPLGDIKELFKHISKEFLMNEYGGNAGSISELHGNTKQLILQNRDYFLNERNKTVDESKIKSNKSSWLNIW